LRIGDQTLGLGSIVLSKQLKTIGAVRTRAANSVFQPNQTVDSVTISGERIAQTIGKEASTDESAFVLAAPGVLLTNINSITIRGGLRTETGFQLDGIPTTEPFFTERTAASTASAPSESSKAPATRRKATAAAVAGGITTMARRRRN